MKNLKQRLIDATWDIQNRIRDGVGCAMCEMREAIEEEMTHKGEKENVEKC